jgi:hypothetical protein
MTPGAKQQGLDRAGRNTERAGDVAHGQVVAVKEDNGCTLAGR